MQITWCTIKDNKNVQSQYLLCPGTGNLVCGQTVNILTTCAKNILDKWTIKDNKNVQSQYLLCPGTGNLVCGQTVNIPTACVKNNLFKWTIKISQQGENLRLYMTNKFNLDTT